MINHKPTREKIYREVYQTLISDTEAQLQEAKIKRDEAYKELVKYGILRSLPDRESELINASTQIQILKDAAEEVKYLTDKLNLKNMILVILTNKSRILEDRFGKAIQTAPLFNQCYYAAMWLSQK